jgi:hypothetical protein
LASLGYAINEEETAAQLAGEQTIRAVRSFQREHRIPIDRYTLVDVPTLRALNEALAARGFLPAAARSLPQFLVVGTVTDIDGVPYRDLKVTAFDRAFRSQQSLGEATTDWHGRYGILYGLDQLTRPNKGAADLIIAVQDRAGTTLHESSVIFAAPAYVAHDIRLSVHGLSEFERIALDVRRALADSGVEVQHIDGTGEHNDILMLARETEYTEPQIAQFGIALRLQHSTSLDARFLFALLRLQLLPSSALSGIDTTRDLATSADRIHGQFAAVNVSAVREALARAVDTNVIRAEPSEVDNFVASFFSAAEQISASESRFGLSVQDIVRYAGVSVEISEMLRREANAASDVQDLVSRLRRSDAFSGELADRVEGVTALARLSMGNAAFVAMLESRIASLDDVRRMARREPDAWKADFAVGFSDEGIPSSVSGKSTADRRDRYVNLVHEQFRNAFPTVAFVADGLRDPEPMPGILALGDLLERWPALDLVEASIDAVATMASSGFALDDGSLAAAKAAQRLFKIAPNYAAAKVLASASLTSAQAVYLCGEDRTTRLLTEQAALSAIEATQVYDRAAAAFATVVHLAGHVAATTRAGDVAALATGAPHEPATLPDLRTLFGISSQAACSDCESVLSPSAYLTDLLLFLSKRMLEDGRTALDVLLSRRPDLRWTELDCPNALTPLPYIDLVCEVLEDAVAINPINVLDRGLIAVLPRSNQSARTLDPGVRAALGQAGDGRYPVEIASTARISAREGDSWTLWDGKTKLKIIDQETGPLVVVPLAPIKETQDFYDEALALAPEYVTYDVVANLPQGLAEKLPSTSESAIKIAIVEALKQAKPPIIVSTDAIVSRKLDDSWIVRDGSIRFRIIERGNAPLAVVPVRGTSGSAEERSIDPEHVSASAYERLTQGRYPWALPFDPVIVEVREILAKLGVSRHDLLRLLRKPNEDATEQEIAAEYLGIAPELAIRLCKQNLGDPYKDWGADSTRDATKRITHASDFMAVTGLTYLDLVRLLTLAFPNPGGRLRLETINAEDLSLVRIVTLDETTLDSLHRFIRLAKTLGWPHADVDGALRSPKIGNALQRSEDAAGALIALGKIVAIRRRLTKLRGEEVVALFGDLPVVGTFEALGQPWKPSLYEQLFLDPRNADDAFAVDKVTGANNDLLASHIDVVLAALQIRPEELEQLLMLNVPGSSKLYFGDQPKLQLAILSALFRHTLLARSLGLPITEWVIMVGLARHDPFESPARLLEFLDDFDQLRSLPLSLRELAYVLVGDRSVPAASSSATLLWNIKELRQKLLRSAVYPNPTPEVAEDVITQFAMQISGLSRDVVFALLKNSTINDEPLIKHLARITELPETALGAEAAVKAIDVLQRWGLLLLRIGASSNDIGFALGRGGEAEILWRLPTAVFSSIDEGPTPAERASLGRRLVALIKLIALNRSSERSPKSLYELMSQSAQFNASDVELSLGWPATTVSSLIDVNIGSDLREQLKTADKWLRLAAAVDLVARVGLPVTTVTDLAAKKPGLDQARALRRALRARVGSAAYADAMRPVQDRIREQKRDALVAFLLNRRPRRPPAPNLKWQEADDLFAYFLIDPAMAPCQVTSRIIQASAAIQLFVQRAFMGLEPELAESMATEPSWKQWKWMKSYRLWEANRKVFLFPENWLEPEFRRNKSQEFKEFEDDILQGEINEETVEAAFVAYLDKLDQISNLDITGMHWEDAAGERGSLVHLIGRTPGQEPHRFFNTTFSETDQKWTAWRRIDVDLKNGSPVPFVFDGKLHLAWPEFQDQPARISSKVKVPEAGGGRQPVTTALPDVAMKIAVSELRHGKWTPKKIARDDIQITADVEQDEDTPRGGDFKQKDTSPAGLKRNLFFVPFDLREFDSVREFVFATFADGKIVFRYGTDREHPEKLKLPIPLNYNDVRSGIRADLIEGRFVEKDGTDVPYDLFQKTPGTFRVLLPLHAVTADSSSGSNSSILLRKKEYRPYIYADDRRSFFVKPKPREGSQILLAYHPFARQFRNILVAKGIDELMQRKTQFSVSSFVFALDYITDESRDPQYWHNYPAETVEFDRREAYSLYNWELFFHAPLFIATRLSQNGRFEEAARWFHFIFDPSGPDPHGLELPRQPDWETRPYPGGTQKFWITKPFFERQGADYVDQLIAKIMKLISAVPDEPDVERRKQLEAARAQLIIEVRRWRENPFDPHQIASGRTVAYQKATVMKYLDNLIAWGDKLFASDKLEEVFEALQLYVLASEILGPRPVRLPSARDGAAKTYAEIEANLDTFGNALVAVENLLPIMPTRLPRPPLSLYFCIPRNEKLSRYWDLVEDRLYKVRHCLSLDGRFRQLDLFSPSLDPGALVAAWAAGGSISEREGDVGTHYRFHTWLRKANELAADLKALGSSLLSIFEKKDVESLSRMRQAHEIRLLQLIRASKEAMIQDAELTLSSLELGREMAATRTRFYETREFMNSGENSALMLASAALVVQGAARSADIQGGTLAMIPNFIAGGSGFGGSPHAVIQAGGTLFSKAYELAARGLTHTAAIFDRSASIVATVAGYKRRFEDWQLQREIAEREIEQYEAQIQASRIKIEIAKRDLAAHELQIQDAKDVDAYLQSKYTNAELYAWMTGQLSRVFFETYRLAYGLAKRAERSFHFDFYPDSEKATPKIIGEGAWNSQRSGLMAGEILQLDLQRLEQAYLEANTRRLELTKHISLSALQGDLLPRLRRDGKCEFTLSESMFDLDYAGHYLRRLKTVAMTIPCVAGPYTTVACTLRLLKHSIRMNQELLDEKYERQQNDTRFRDRVAGSSIATSTAQNDPGLFDLSFDDDRYLPFEGEGVIGTWSLELQQRPELRTFDYETISDVVLHLRYTAQEGADTFRDRCLDSLKAHLNALELRHIFRIPRDFAGAWRDYKQSRAASLILPIEPSRFVRLGVGRTIRLESAQIVGRLTTSASIKWKLGSGPEYDLLPDSSLDAQSEPVPVGPILLDQPVEWTLEFRHDDGTFEAFDSAHLDDLYLIVAYKTESAEGG